MIRIGPYYSYIITSTELSEKNSGSWPSILLGLVVSIILWTRSVSEAAETLIFCLHFTQCPLLLLCSALIAFTREVKLQVKMTFLGCLISVIVAPDLGIALPNSTSVYGHSLGQIIESPLLEPLHTPINDLFQTTLTLVMIFVSLKNIYGLCTS